MLEYEIDDAEALLDRNLAAATKSLGMTLYYQSFKPSLVFHEKIK